MHPDPCIMRVKYFYFKLMLLRTCFFAKFSCPDLNIFLLQMSNVVLKFLFSKQINCRTIMIGFKATRIQNDQIIWRIMQYIECTMYIVHQLTSYNMSFAEEWFHQIGLSNRKWPYNGIINPFFFGILYIESIQSILQTLYYRVYKEVYTSLTDSSKAF